MTTSGKYITISGEPFYLIENYNEMHPFFISLASDTDLWMYIASTGGLTAGRRNPEQVLFPYYTDDKITENYETTGPKTLIRVYQTLNSQSSTLNSKLWEPFSNRYMGIYRLKRSIAKSTTGNKLLFIEQNIDLGLTFTYQWAPSDTFGWVRKATLINDNDYDITIELLDGLQNVMPAGVEQKTQNVFSTLVDAYKKTEQVPNLPLVLFRMEAILVDRAEPSEALRCNTVFTLGLNDAQYLTSSDQLDAFRQGLPPTPEPQSKGMRGAIFAHTQLYLAANGKKTWYNICDVMQDNAQVRKNIHFLQQPDAIGQVELALQLTTNNLRAIVGKNDGIQHSADQADDARHFANTLFNTMRGGFYCDNYDINGAAFAKHIYTFNRPVAEKYKAFLTSLPDTITYHTLEERILGMQDHQLHRLFSEYLPITFSRRHGDPSRPWNMFDVRVKDNKGKYLISYQGNWRDIFQNWEALSLSYPNYINGIIAKFLNATTADGYNPYKVTSEGIDWEVIEPENPWSNIGYWGDHQIIYLCRLLELSYAHNPQSLREMLADREFAFANVPYRFRTYAEIVRNPKDSIFFDNNLHKQIFKNLPEYGQDARLILGGDNQPLLVTFTEKVLITLLTKLSNFVPEAGIWMNTLRPEWNDANNALVGYGASMVTLYYMRRFVAFLLKLYTDANKTYSISTEVVLFLRDINAAMAQHDNICTDGDICFNNQSRRQFIDTVGTAGERYRESVYQGYSGNKVEIDIELILSFLNEVQKYLDQSITVNRRPDGLYNAYNLITFGNDTVSVEPLYEMLEGQVAILSAGILSSVEVADLLDTMRQSPLYRADQRSYTLYPNRILPTFLNKNNLPAAVLRMPVVTRLLSKQDANILVQDCDGGIHFNADFRNADYLAQAIDCLIEPVTVEEKQQLLNIYEQIFNHHAFTGRSGTFYKYEGIGSIYWHMVSKLLLAVGENIQKAIDIDADTQVIQRLQQQYEAIREGIGAHKTPVEYGSFPFDAYSHTPALYEPTETNGYMCGGVQQPGMTGQVKEDIISRFFELGVHIDNGNIVINTTMLRTNMFVDNQLHFTYCQTPFVYQLGTQRTITVSLADGKILSFDTVIPTDTAQHIFARDGQVRQVVVTIQL